MAAYNDPYDSVQEEINKQVAIGRAVPKMAGTTVPDPLRDVGVTDNKTYPKNNGDLDIAEQVGYNVAVRAIYIQTGKHLGPNHPVMQLIRNMKA